MKKNNSYFRDDTLIHCYQNTIDGFLLFYTISDYLVFFTRYCVTAKKYGVITYSLCIMPDHVHSGVYIKSRKQLSGFWDELQTLTAKDNNRICKRKGPLYNPGFGFAVKEGDKQIRTNLVYIGNNPVERHLVRLPEEYRWNFLAYSKSDHPFSKKLVIRRASTSMKKAVRTVKDEYRRNQPLSYPLLQRLFKSLNKEESIQLVDLIVSTYSVIDYNLINKSFGSAQSAIQAMHYNTGSEYDIKESFTVRSDAHYSKFTSYLLDKLQIEDIHQVLSYSEEKRIALYYELSDVFYSVPTKQICKYLRLKSEPPSRHAVFHK